MKIKQQRLRRREERLTEKLGWGPGQGVEETKPPRGISKPEGAGVLGAPGEVGQLLPEVLDVGAEKGELRPAEQGETPEPPGADGEISFAQASEALDTWFTVQIMDPSILLYDDYDTLLNEYRSKKAALKNGQMTAEDVFQFVTGATEKVEVPEATQTPTTTPGPTPPFYTTYIIKSGDTLDAIATKNGMTVTELAGYNNIQDEDKINSGDELKIPVGAGTPIPTGAIQEETVRLSV